MGEATKTGEPEQKPDYSAFEGTRPVTERQRFDSDALGAWLAQHVDGMDTATLIVAETASSDPARRSSAFRQVSTMLPLTLCPQACASR